MKGKTEDPRPVNYLTFDEYRALPESVKPYAEKMDAEKARFAFLDGTLSVNLNTEVRVTLTPKGQQIVATLPMLEQQALSHTYNHCLGELRVPLWEFCRIFGPHFHMGGAVPTERNAVELLPDRSPLRPAPPLPKLSPITTRNAQARRPKKGGRS